MVHHVPIVAVLTIVQGVLEVLMSLLFLFASLYAPELLDMMQQMGGRDNEMAELISIVYLIMGAPTLMAGLFHIVVGIRIFTFRGRTMGIVGLIFGAGSLASCYCAPTSLGVMIYGLIVLMNQEVVQAFELAEQGYRPDDIRRMAANGEFRVRRRERWDDVD